MKLDVRIPVVFGSAGDAGPADAVLTEGKGTAAPGRDWFQVDVAPAHPAGCACCPPRNAAGQALSRLILARGRGTGPFFRRVIVDARSEAGRGAVQAALDTDPVVSCMCRQG